MSFFRVGTGLCLGLCILLESIKPVGVNRVGQTHLGWTTQNQAIRLCSVTDPRWAWMAAAIRRAFSTFDRSS